MPQSQQQTADDIIKKCHNVGEKLLQSSETNKNVVPSSTTITPLGIGPAGRVHYLHELPHAAEERYADIFRQLDRKGDSFVLFSLVENQFAIQ